MAQDYVVHGASKANGASAWLLTSADTELEAREIAATKGIMVARVSTDPAEIERAREARARHEADRRAADQAAHEASERRRQFEAASHQETRMTPWQAWLARRHAARADEPQRVQIAWSLREDFNLIVVIACGVFTGLLAFSCIGWGLVIGGSVVLGAAASDR